MAGAFLQTRGTVASATALREKEAAEYAKSSSEASANIKACNEAIVAIEKGMAGAFLQTRGASILRHLSTKVDLEDADRQSLAAFLQGSQSDGYAPSSGQITGILKTMSDEMTAAYNDAKAAEDAAIAAYE